MLQAIEQQLAADWQESLDIRRIEALSNLSTKTQQYLDLMSKYEELKSELAYRSGRMLKDCSIVVEAE